jgi:transposase
VVPSRWQHGGPITLASDTHTAVAVDDLGRRLGEYTVRTNSDSHLRLLSWAGRFEQVRFAVEDCRRLTRRLEGDLLTAGHRVVRVPTRLMAQARRGARTPGKSDPIDAEAVAIAALRHPGLPVAALDGPSREIKLLSDYRRDLVGQRTRACSQLRWHLHELDPDLHVPSRSLNQASTRAKVAAFLTGRDGLVARLARELLERIGQLTDQIKALEKELTALVTAQAPSLLAIPGCGVISAAILIGETAAVTRFRDKDTFARFTGTAPVPVWSGATAGKVRLNRGGNRQANYALHIIAVTQARGIGPGRDYCAKQQARGKDHIAALRLLRRRLSDTVFTALRADQRNATPALPHAA